MHQKGPTCLLFDGETHLHLLGPCRRLRYGPFSWRKKLHIPTAVSLLENTRTPLKKKENIHAPKDPGNPGPVRSEPFLSLKCCSAQTRCRMCKWPIEQNVALFPTRICSVPVVRDRVQTNSTAFYKCFRLLLSIVFPTPLFSPAASSLCLDIRLTSPFLFSTSVGSWPFPCLVVLAPPLTPSASHCA